MPAAPALSLTTPAASTPPPCTRFQCLIRAACHACAESGGVRPFGVSLLMAGHDENGPQLYQVDPSGSYFAWKASAIGKNMVNAKAFLEKRYSEDMELEDAIHTALLTLKEGFEGELTGGASTAMWPARAWRVGMVVMHAALAW